MAQELKENHGQGCAVDCSLKGSSPSCSSGGGCGSRPNVMAWLTLFLTAFVIGVWALANFGGSFLETQGKNEKTVGILDMARQCVQTKDYAGAEQLFRQAISDAEVEGGDRLAYALASYAEFLRKRKRVPEAIPLEERAKQIQGIEPVPAKASS